MTIQKGYEQPHEILECLSKNQPITLATLCQKLGAEGSVSRIGHIGTLVGKLLRDGEVVRDESKQYPNWTIERRQKEKVESE